VSLIILYRNPNRPDEAVMTMIVGQAEAAAVINRLEKRGCVVDKITFAPFFGFTPTGADRPQTAGTPRNPSLLSE
jgi:hypothetical protein